MITYLALLLEKDGCLTVFRFALVKYNISKILNGIKGNCFHEALYFVLGKFHV